MNTALRDAAWVMLRKTSPSGKALFVCLDCARVSPTPDKVCDAGCGGEATPAPPSVSMEGECPRCGGTGLSPASSVLSMLRCPGCDGAGRSFAPDPPEAPEGEAARRRPTYDEAMDEVVAWATGRRSTTNTMMDIEDGPENRTETLAAIAAADAAETVKWAALASVLAPYSHPAPPAPDQEAVEELREAARALLGAHYADRGASDERRRLRRALSRLEGGGR